MKKDGAITLNGHDIQTLATGPVLIEAKDDVQIKGKNVKSNS